MRNGREARVSISRKQLMAGSAGVFVVGAVVGANTALFYFNKRLRQQLEGETAQQPEVKPEIKPTAVAPTALPTIPVPPTEAVPTQVPRPPAKPSPVPPTATQVEAPKPTVAAAPTVPAKEPTKAPEQKAFTIELGKELEVFRSGKFGITHVPDGHTSLLRTDGNDMLVFVTGGRQSYLLKGPTFEHLMPHKLDQNNRAEPVLSPDPKDAFGRDYRGFGSVLRLDNNRPKD